MDKIVVDIYKSTKRNKHVLIPQGKDVTLYEFNDPDLKEVQQFRLGVTIQHGTIGPSLHNVISAINDVGFYISTATIKISEN